MSSQKQLGLQKKAKRKKNEKQDIDKIFEQMDLNHDGRISVMELTKAARLLGLNPTRKEAEMMIQDCNPAQKGYVTKSEFKKLFEDRQADIEQQIKEISDAFKVFDKDNSGTISADEIRAVLKKCGEDLDDKELDEMLRRVDVDGDGKISIEEFAAVMCDLH